MNSKKGQFIIIEGTDGSGKTTQINILVEKLLYFGFKIKTIDFPQYNKKSAGLVEEYLEGNYGSLEDVGPYISSIFYACDRYDAGFKIKKWLDKGYLVIANRYVVSNMGHQGSKIDNSLERKFFYSWLNSLEYGLFKIPIPDLTVILHLKSEIAQSLALNNKTEKWHNKTNDIHENNYKHLQKAEKTYLEIAKKFPNIKLVKCFKNNQVLTKSQIHDMVWSIISNYLLK
jgi:dTMP kinase